MSKSTADKSTMPNASPDPHVRYDEEPRLSKNGKPIPKGLTPWRKGQSGNPGGRPKDEVTPSQAYRAISQCTFAECKKIAEGKFPPNWTKGHQMAYVRAAQETISAGSKGKPEEINGRISGPIGQDISLTLEGSPLAILAQLMPPAAARMVQEPAIDTPALPGSDNEDPVL
jgi:hypothetical protein